MISDYKKKVIIALDFNNIESAKDLIGKLKGEVYFYKVGLELFLNCGKEIVVFLKESGYKIFLDLKFYDIPNTVYNAVRSAGLLGADIINVHASGGIEMMKAAKKGLSEAEDITGKKIELFAVTVLTSFSSDSLKEIFYFDKYIINIKEKSIKFNNSGNDCSGSINTNNIKPYHNDFKDRYTGYNYTSGQQNKLINGKAGENIAENIALHLAGLAKISGIDGVVCSPLESMSIKTMFGDNFKTITPGIRLEENGIIKQNDDQKRIMTPSKAFESKADYIVVGRPVTRAADPLLSLKNIYKDIQNAYLNK
ncbi:MAG: orotidine-5'-phosphate decarboxylase [bacterium]